LRNPRCLANLREKLHRGSFFLDRPYERSRVSERLNRDVFANRPRIIDGKWENRRLRRATGTPVRGRGRGAALCRLIVASLYRRGRNKEPGSRCRRRKVTVCNSPPVKARQGLLSLLPTRRPRCATPHCTILFLRFLLCLSFSISPRATKWCSRARCSRGWILRRRTNVKCTDCCLKTKAETSASCHLDASHGILCINHSRFYSSFHFKFSVHISFVVIMHECTLHQVSCNAERRLSWDIIRISYSLFRRNAIRCHSLRKM